MELEDRLAPLRAQAVLGAHAVDDFFHDGPALRSDLADMGGDGEPLALHACARDRLELRAQEGLGRVQRGNMLSADLVTDRRARSRDVEAVAAGVGDLANSDERLHLGSIPSAHDRDERESGSCVAEHGTHLRGEGRVLGTRDDRRQGAVVVEEQRDAERTIDRGG
jgi:hypothetical protein